MRKYVTLISFALICCVAGVGYADQVAVNIVYPISGRGYPITDPPPGKLKSAYIPASFSVTCKGDHKVEWGFDTSASIGSAVFYDEISMQFIYKLPGGGHIFRVKSDCGENKVKFKVGK